MKIHVTGFQGSIGSHIVKRGCFPLPCDITDITEVDNAIRKDYPDIIIHLAGKSDVNWCQDNPRVATQTNYRGAVNVFSMAEKYNIPVVLLSTDHVFSGRWFGNYPEYSQDFHPVNIYGLTKMGAEGAAISFPNVKIVRTSTLFWNDRGMVKGHLDNLRKGIPVIPPMFMCRSFMHIDHLCTNLISHAVGFKDMPKILHLSGSKTVSWYTFIKAWAKTIGKEHLVHPRFWNVDNYMDAPRPLRTGLSTKLSQSIGFKQFDYLDGIREGV